MTVTDLSDVPFIFDAKAKVAVLRGTAGDDKLVFRLVHRHDDDSHTVVVATDGEDGLVFHLTEDALSFDGDRVRIRIPELELTLDPVYARKFRAFTRGNYPTPDIAGETLP